MCLVEAPQLHPHTPLRENSSLLELSTLLDSHVWRRAGLLFLQQLFEEGEFIPYAILCEHFHVDNAQLYHYLLLRHAIHAQLGSLSYDEDTRFMIYMLQQGPHKHIIELLYAVLCTQDAVTRTSTSRLA